MSTEFTMTSRSVSHLVITIQRYLLCVKRVPAQHLPPCPGQQPTSAHCPITASHNPSLDFQFPGLFWSRCQGDHSLQWEYTGAPRLQAIAGLITETSSFFWYHNLATQPPELLATVWSLLGHTPTVSSLMTKQLPTEFRARFIAIEKTHQTKILQKTPQTICAQPQHQPLAHAQCLSPQCFPLLPAQLFWSAKPFTGECP